MGSQNNLPDFKLFSVQETVGPKQQLVFNNSNLPTCNHLQQIHNNCPKLCKITNHTQIPAIRKLPPPGQLKAENILQEYGENFSDLGCLGHLVHFTPIQMPTHRAPVTKRDQLKVALDRYEQEEITKKVEEPTSWCSNELIKEIAGQH